MALGKEVEVQPVPLKHAERKKLGDAVREVNEVHGWMQTSGITGTKKLIRAAAIVVVHNVGIKQHNTQATKEPFGREELNIK